MRCSAILLLVLQLGFVAVLYLILFGFARSLLRDLRSAEARSWPAASGIGRLSVLESPEDEPPAGHARSRSDRSTPSAATSTARSSWRTTS